MRQLCSLHWEFSTNVFQILRNTKAKTARVFSPFPLQILLLRIKKFTGEDLLHEQCDAAASPPLACRN
jgi:hypothetical protein